MWVMEAFQEEPRGLFSAIGMFLGRYQSTLWVIGLWNFIGKPWTGSMGLNSRSVFWTCLFQSIIKGLSQFSQMSIYDAKLQEGLSCSPTPFTAWYIRSFRLLGEKSIKDSSGRNHLGLTCIHAELRILIFSSNCSNIFRKNGSL